jgi:hypothetical protein
MKKIRLLIIGVLLVVLSGCFPVFVPGPGGGGRGGHEGHGGGERGGEHRDRH